MKSTIKGPFLLGSALMLILLLGGCFLFPNQSPVAQFAALPPRGDAPLTVQFDAQGSYDSDGQIISWQWDFGDGEIGVGIVVSHRYIVPGSYTVRLTVNDNRGSTVSSTLILVVSDPGDFYRHYEWEYGEDRYYWNIAIPKWLYHEYRQRPRGPWDMRDYDEYVLDLLDDMYMKSLGQTIESAMGGDYYKTVECAFNFVQAAVAFIDDPRGFEYPRYPIESLVDEIGDCEDTAILYASLVRTLGYGALISAVATEHNGEADHMVTLVPVHSSYAESVTCPWWCNWSFWWYKDQLYALAETTGEPQSTGYYYPLGCDPWGLGSDDFTQIWDVSRVDLSPQVVKWVPRP